MATGDPYCVYCGQSGHYGVNCLAVAASQMGYERCNIYDKSTELAGTSDNTTKPWTGGLKDDSGKPMMQLLSSIAMRERAKVLTHGATKYGAHNWRKGIEWSRLIGATLRHLAAFTAGEDFDPETGLSHLAHAACCLDFLLEYQETHKELDDRYKNEKAL